MRLNSSKPQTLTTCVWMETMEAGGTMLSDGRMTCVGWDLRDNDIGFDRTWPHIVLMRS